VSQQVLYYGDWIDSDEGTAHRMEPGNGTAHWTEIGQSTAL